MQHMAVLIITGKDNTEQFKNKVRSKYKVGLKRLVLHSLRHCWRHRKMNRFQSSCDDLDGQQVGLWVFSAVHQQMNTRSNLLLGKDKPL